MGPARWLPPLAVAWSLVSLASAGSAQAEPTSADNAAQRARVEQKLDELKTMRKDLSRTMQDFDARIEALEAEMRGAPPPKPPKTSKAKGSPADNRCHKSAGCLRCGGTATGYDG